MVNHRGWAVKPAIGAGEAFQENLPRQNVVSVSSISVKRLFSTKQAHSEWALHVILYYYR